MDSLTTLAMIAAVAFGVWWWFRQGAAHRGQAEAQLRRICFGDAAQVERLINAEMARSPGITRDEAASRAVLRYQRDNR